MALTPFEQYFATRFQISLDHVGDEVVFSSGFTISSASWDRKAAYLLWVELGRPGDNTDKTVKTVDEEWDIL